MKMFSKCSLVAVDSMLIVQSRPASRIIMDIREPACYEKSHIKDAVNLLTSSLLLRRLQRGSLTITNLLPASVASRLQNDDCDSLVLYDENSCSENENRNLSVIYGTLRKTFPKKNICYLNKGFAQFCEEHPQHCEFDYPVDGPNPLQITLNGDLTSDPTDRKAFSPDTDLCPVAILPHLYLGNAHHASQKDLLDKLGITAILNVSKTCPMFANHYEYKTIAIDDNDRENISSHFEEAVKFIDDVKSRNGRILVHCMAGISRSATICIAYLMGKYNYSLDQAYEYIKKLRSAISPNFNFLGQLLTLEGELNAKRNVEGMKRPATACFPMRLSLDLTKAPVTCTQFNKNTEVFTYSPVPKNCMSFFGCPDVSSARRSLPLMTPS